jgi:hypothetical protein
MEDDAMQQNQVQTLSLATTLAADLGSVGLGGLYKILDLQCLFQLELQQS